MVWSKEHFELIAKVVREHLPTELLDGGENTVYIRAHMCNAFAKELANKNPLFNPVRFKNACEGEDK